MSKQLIAIHQVVYVAEGAKVQSVAQPKAEFTASDADAEYLIESGAAKLAEGEAEQAPAGKGRGGKKKKQEDAPVVEDDEPAAEDDLVG